MRSNEAFKPNERARVAMARRSAKSYAASNSQTHQQYALTCTVAWRAAMFVRYALLESDINLIDEIENESLPIYPKTHCIYALSYAIDAINDTYHAQWCSFPSLSSLLAVSEEGEKSSANWLPIFNSINVLCHLLPSPSLRGSFNIWTAPFRPARRERVCYRCMKRWKIISEARAKMVYRNAFSNLRTGFLVRFFHTLSSFTQGKLRLWKIFYDHLFCGEWRTCGRAWAAILHNAAILNALERWIDDCFNEVYKMQLQMSFNF